MAAGNWRLRRDDFDRLSLTGIAVLDGTLELSLIDGHVPVLDHSLYILLAPGGVTGMFADVIQPATMILGVKFDVVYSTTLVQLHVVASDSTFTADFDQDGDVDAADLTQWKGDFNLNGDSNADNDGDSDGADFLAWQRQLSSSSGADSVVDAVPEPTALSLLLLVLAGFAVCLDRRDERHVDRSELTSVN